MQIMYGIEPPPPSTPPPQIDFKHNTKTADGMQVWQYTESNAHALVQSIIRSCYESQDTRIHRAGIHALIAAVKACWHDGKRVC